MSTLLQTILPGLLLCFLLLHANYFLVETGTPNVGGGGVARVVSTAQQHATGDTTNTKTKDETPNKKHSTKGGTHQDEVEQDAALVAKSLEMFKRRVLPKIPATSYVVNFSKHDSYLLRWLKASDNNVNKAESNFVEHLKWREENDIERINTETEFHNDYVTYYDSGDRQGRPVGEIWFTRWDMHDATDNGEEEIPIGVAVQAFEMLERRLCEQKSKGRIMKDATPETIFLVDVAKYSVTKQGCPKCVAAFKKMGALYEKHYHGQLATLYLLDDAKVSVEDPADVAKEIAGEVLSSETVHRMKLLQNRKKWVRELDEHIGRGERSPLFGGTKARDSTPQDVSPVSQSIL